MWDDRTGLKLQPSNQRSCPAQARVRPSGAANNQPTVVGAAAFELAQHCAAIPFASLHSHAAHLGVPKVLVLAALLRPHCSSGRTRRTRLTINSTQNRDNALIACCEEGQHPCEPVSCTVCPILDRFELHQDERQSVLQDVPTFRIMLRQQGRFERMRTGTFSRCFFIVCCFWRARRMLLKPNKVSRQCQCRKS
jgi:hypothetical protein